MRTYIKTILSIVVCTIFTACGGGGGSSGGGNGPNGSSDTVILGNVTTIPTGYATVSATSMVVTNNTTSVLNLDKDSITVKIGQLTLKGESQTQNYIDTSQCNILKNQCSVTVNAPSADGSYLVTLVFNNPATNKNYIGSQIITYSSHLSETNGFIVSNLNTNIGKAVTANATLAVPFVLTNTYSNLTATLGVQTSNGIVANKNSGLSTMVSCPAGVFSLHSLCTAYVTAGNIGSTNLTQLVLTLSGEPSTSGTLFLNSTSKLLKAQGSSGYSATIPVTIVQNQVANLITSGFNLAITPTSGSQLVWLLNTGLASANNIGVGTIAPFTITNNNCLDNNQVLTQNNACSFTVNASGNTAGQGFVMVNYNDTIGNQQLGFNVLYLPPNLTNLLVHTTGLGSLQYVPQNTTSSLIINVANSGTSDLSQINFNSNMAQIPGMAFGNGSCKTDGTQTLVAGASCTLVVNYTPTTSNASGTLQITTSASSPTGTYSSGTYSALYSSSSGPVSLTLSPNVISFAIRADGNESVTQVFTLTNSGSTASTSAPSITLPSISGFSLESNGCTAGLAVGAACSITTKFGPTTTIESNTTGVLMVNYPATPVGPTESATAIITFNASNAALISISNIALSGGAGSGTQSSAYAFTNSPTNKMNAIITYTNNGTLPATNFNVALGGLPIGYSIDSSGSTTTCGVESKTITLSPGASCKVGIYAVESNGLTNPYFFSGSLNTTLPGWSYTDATTGVNRNFSPVYNGSNTLYVTANTFANVTVNSVVSGSSSTAYTESATFIVNSLANGTSAVNINLPTVISGQGIINSVVNNGCSASVGNPCTITINFIPGINSQPISYPYMISPSGSSFGINGNLIFTLP